MREKSNTEKRMARVSLLMGNLYIEVNLKMILKTEKGNNMKEIITLKVTSKKAKS